MYKLMPDRYELFVKQGSFHKLRWRHLLTTSGQNLQFTAFKYRRHVQEHHTSTASRSNLILQFGLLYIGGFFCVEFRGILPEPLHVFA
jgi:hypothetical protein